MADYTIPTHIGLLAHQHFERKIAADRMTTEDMRNLNEIMAVTAYQAHVANAALNERHPPDATDFPVERLKEAQRLAFRAMNIERGDRMAERGRLRSIFGDEGRSRSRGRLHPSFGPRTDDGPDIEPRYRSFDRT